MGSAPFGYVDEGEGEAVLFLHAFPYHHGMWGPQRAALRGRARALAFDARGLGARGHTEAYMLEHTVDDALALLDHLAVERAVLCGVSMGGYAALRLAQRAPERVRGLLLADTQAAADSDAAKLARADGLRALTRDGLSAFADAQLSRQLSPHTRAEAPALVAELRALILHASAAGVASALVAIATRTDLTAHLPQIRVPTRVVVGRDDVITPPALAEAMASAIPGATLTVLERAGHVSNLEAPAAFNAELLALLDALG
jgi:3-oxoadipate enol-lactonase